MITSNTLKELANQRKKEEEWTRQQIKKLYTRYVKKFGGSEEELHYMLHKVFKRRT